MKWNEMKRREPGLRDLEDLARAAGRAGRPWFDTWSRVLYEGLSKVCGWGSGGRFSTAADFRTAHRGLLLAWASPDGPPSVPPWDWESAEHETTPLLPAFGSEPR